MKILYSDSASEFPCLSIYIILKKLGIFIPLFLEVTFDDPNIIPLSPFFKPEAVWNSVIPIFFEEGNHFSCLIFVFCYVVVFHDFYLLYFLLCIHCTSKQEKNQVINVIYMTWHLSYFCKYILRRFFWTCACLSININLKNKTFILRLIIWLSENVWVYIILTK